MTEKKMRIMAAEGLELRRAGITAPVVVLGGAFPGEEEAVVRHDLAAAVWTLAGGRALATAARAAGRTAAVHLKVNTGMHCATTRRGSIWRR